MGFVTGQSRDQGSLFPVVLDDLVPPEHLVRVLHTRLLTAAMIRSLSRVDRRTLAAGLVGYRKRGSARRRPSRGWGPAGRGAPKDY